MATLTTSNHIFITGGAGFLGSHLTEYHLNKGDKVTIIDNLSTGRKKNIIPFMDNPNFIFFENDMLTWDGLDNIVASSDRIYHFAASVGNKYVLEDPFKTLMNNINLCQHLLESVANCNRKATILIASSSEVYGFPLASIFNEPDILCLAPPAQKRSEYALSKTVNESMAKVYHEKYQLRLIVIRFFNTIGPNQIPDYGMVVPRFIQQALAGEPITVIGEGTDTRCFADVRDIVCILDDLAENESIIGKTVNVGDDTEIAITTLAEKVIRLSESQSKIVRVPAESVYGQQFAASNHRRPNLRFLYSLIKHRPIWDIDKTLLDLIQRYRSNASIS